jgi:transcriptional regulator with XRE-family HTH domain
MKNDMDRKKIQEEVGRKLKSRRAYLHLSQTQVANKIKVSQMLISHIELGERNSPRVIRLLDELYSKLEADRQKAMNVVDNTLKNMGYAVPQ